MTNPFGPDAPAFLNFDSSARPSGNSPASSEQRRARTRGRTRPETTGTHVSAAIFVPHWDDDAGDLWDRITLGNYQFRGTVRIGGEGPKLKIEKRKRRGADGARNVMTGYEPAKPRITLRVWTPEHLEDFSALMSEIHPARDPSKRVALDVYHPALALASISRVIVEQPGFLLPSGTPGLFECELACTEYRAPPDRNVTSTVQATGLRAPIGAIDIDPRFRTENDNPSVQTRPSETNTNP